MSEEYAVRVGEFSWALEMLKMGHRVARSGWNGKGMWLVLKKPGLEGSHPFDLPLHPYVAMCTVDKTLVPWLCSQTDMLADDWELVE